jgi:hypothetical protein
MITLPFHHLSLSIQDRTATHRTCYHFGTNESNTHREYMSSPRLKSSEHGGVFSKEVSLPAFTAQAVAQTRIFTRNFCAISTSFRGFRESTARNLIPARW